MTLIRSMWVRATLGNPDECFGFTNANLALSRRILTLPGKSLVLYIWQGGNKSFYVCRIVARTAVVVSDTVKAQLVDMTARRKLSPLANRKYRPKQQYTTKKINTLVHEWA